MLRDEHRFTANLLLRALSSDDRTLLRPHLARLPLPKGYSMAATGQPVQHVYFPEGGVVSIVSGISTRGPTEVGLFGREGMSASFLLLGTDRSPLETFVQVPGESALRIAVDDFMAAVAASETLRSVMLRYIQTALVQNAISIATNARHRIEVRLARWILMCHDRIDGDEIALTHEAMGQMIAAERSGITVTLHILEGEGVIRSKRGRVIVRDRARLEKLAGDSYGVPEAEYRRLIGPIGRTVTADVRQRPIERPAPNGAVPAFA